MKARQLLSFFTSLILLFLLGPVALAQTPTPTPASEDPYIQVSEDGIVDGTVSIVHAYTEGPAWVVIHADADGKPGPVIGHAALEPGDNVEITVEIDEEAATPLLHAMLHVDEGVVGTFEFPGPDVPMTIGENIVMALFSAAPPLEETEATPTAAAEEESETEAAASAEATPTAAAEEESEAESAAGVEATPTAAAEEETEEEETESEAAATAAPEEEAEFAPTAVAAEETEAEAAAPAADAGAKGAAPTSMPATGAGPALSLILGVIGVVVSALGGSVLFSRRRS